MNNAQALLDQAQVELGYAQVLAPVTGIVNVRAARQGEVVAAGTPIVTVIDLTQTWVYAPLPETQADAVQLGDTLRVVMPSGETIQGKVIAKPPRPILPRSATSAATSAISRPCNSSCSSTIRA